MINGAEAMVGCLEHEGVKIAFGIPGAAICPFYDALTYSTINHILVRHEQNAGHAASGYARISNRPAVCTATSGPGALNLLTAIATAYMDSVPMIAITGQVSTELLGRDVFQEADITGAAEPFVKHSYLIKDANDIPRIFKEAFHIASTGRQGPVLIDIPVDVQKTTLTYDFVYPEIADIRSYKPNIKGHMGQIKRLLSAVKDAQKPLLCVGGGIFSSCAQNELLMLSQNANIPVVTTMMGLSCISPTYSKNLGMIGMYGSAIANRAMSEADLIILVGARVGDRAIMSPLGLSRTAKIVHIDIDPVEIGKNINTNIPIVGDAKSILSVVNDRISTVCTDWFSSLAANKNGSASQSALPANEIINTLMQLLPDDSCITADVGQNQIWAARSYSIENGRFLTSGGMGTMGYSIPAAIGAWLSYNEDDRSDNPQVVAICGDGAFQMCMNELATINANSIPIKIIIMNNSQLGLVKELQDNHYQGRYSGVKLAGNPSFNLIAEAYGIPSAVVTSREQLLTALELLIQSKSAYIIECIIDSSETAL